MSILANVRTGYPVDIESEAAAVVAAMKSRGLTPTQIASALAVAQMFNTHDTLINGM